MLDDVFDRAHVCQRLRANWLGAIIDDFSKHMQQRGLARGTMQQYLAALEHFGVWLHKQRSLPKVVTNESVRAFLSRHLPTCRCQAHCPACLRSVRAALNQLVRMLRERGELPVRKHKRTTLDILLQDFRVHLAENCGLAERTIDKRTYYVGAFVKESFAPGRFRPARIRRHHVHEFVASFARTHQPGSTNAVATCLRSFLRFLQFRGQASASLVAAVPTVRKWKLDHLPRAMHDEQLNLFLTQFDRTSDSGRRDYAMALCLAELGLRASEVASMRMADVDWERATLKIPAGKSRRERMLPLTHRVGKALATYLRYGRPKTSAQTVFVRHSSPRGIVLNTEQVRGAMRTRAS